LRWYGDHNIRWRCIEIHCPGNEDVPGKIARSD
jgi:quercetin dioxygenase-like cupin family protein